MTKPDEQNSLAHHWNQTSTDISEPGWVFTREFATQAKVRNHGSCPMVALFFAQFAQLHARDSCKSLKDAAPGEIRTPDRLVRRDNHQF
jgi:alpha-D-ribose 1-methylphosphonate 5-triphosphate synthase subunit PhnH